MKIDWINTPGGYYAIAYIICSIIMIFNGPKKLERKKRVMSLSIFGISLFTLMSVTHGLSVVLFVPLLVLYFVGIWIIIYINCSYSVCASVFIAARTFISAEFIASLEWGIFYYLVHFKVLPYNGVTGVVTLIVIDGVYGFLLYFLERKNRMVNENLQIKVSELISAFVISLAVFAISNVSFVVKNSIAGGLVFSQLFLIRTLVDLGGVAILYAYHVQVGDLKIRYEMEHLQDILAMQSYNYEMLEQSVNVVNQKYHDLKYQIAVLKSEVNVKESLDYLDQMEREIKAYEAQNKTGNKILDTVLTGKSLYCQSNWIELTSVVDGETLSFMEPMDISTLFGNMLDNATESVMKIEKKERRLIHLAVAKQKNFLRIRMENCYDKKPQIENGQLVTSKKDKIYHGYGMKSIQNIVKKYGGSIAVQANDGWFEVRILIPLKT